jgi:prenyltransferase beta subunit
MNGYIASKQLFHDQSTPDYRATVNYDTGYSVGSLTILGKLGDINPSLVASYLSSVQFTDGGWSGANCTDEPIDEVTDCYPVIFAFQQLGEVSAIRDTDGFVDFLLRCLSPVPTYGFSNLPNTFSNTWQTYDGVCILYDLGLLNATMSAAICNSLISSYNLQNHWFMWTRSSYPASSDGYSEPIVDAPLEYSETQRSTLGVIMTDMAVSALTMLGCQNWTSIHAQEMWDTIAQSEMTTGSYSGYYTRTPNTPISNLTAGLRYTYYALDCLWTLAHYLNMTNSFQSHLANATMTTNKIMSLYDSLTGSFNEDGYVLDPYSQVETTYFALASLKLLNETSLVDTAQTAGFLQAHLYTNLVDAYYSFKGLELLNKLTVINATALLQLVESSQNPDGSFWSNQTALYRLDTTRMAMEILSYYNHTWVDNKQIELIACNIQLPNSMQLGENYIVNLNLVDSKFNLPVTGATVELSLGAYEFTAAESPEHSGEYTVNLSVPVDYNLFGNQSLIIRCSKETYGTNITQMKTEVKLGNGSGNRAPTEIDFLEPADDSHVMTYNASMAVSICAFNGSKTPVAGAQLQLLINNSLSDTALSNSSGSLTFAWRPNSSGTYNIEVVFDGTDSLNGSLISKTVYVDKTPTELTLITNCSDETSLKVGSTINLEAKLCESPTEKVIGQVDVSFIVTTPSGSQMSLVTITSADGTATAQLTPNENGDYSIYSEYATNGYYQGCTSNLLVFTVMAGAEGSGGMGDGGLGGGGGSSSNSSGGSTWVGGLLNALLNPFGALLVVVSGSLMAIVYLTRTERRGPDLIAEEADDDGATESVPPNNRRNLRKKRT